ncbi:MAG TPA: SRPBCC domain-containing protein [Casimicrobiaceae bacterium]|nr:SRPBCC domain-containing protein [Casimicrobiaceae bacterium]
MKILVVLLAVAASVVAHAQERYVDKEVRVKAPLDAVWQAWTTTDGIKSFFAPDAHVEAIVEGPFEIYINPLAEPGMRGADGMRFLAIQEKKMLTFTWNAPPSLPEARAQRTYVTLRFKPLGDDETLVTLHHGGWGEGGEWDKAYAYFDKAWSNVLANLEKRFATGKPQDWTEWMANLRAYMEKEKQAPPK